MSNVSTVVLALEFAVLALAGALVLRVLAKPSVRAEAGTMPLVLAAAVLLGAGLLAGTAWAMAQWPIVRHAIAVVAALLVAAAWWRARPSYGDWRRWPRGSLGIAHSFDAIHRRGWYRDQAMKHGPVFKMSQFGRPVACVTGLQRAHAILTAHADDVLGASLPYDRLVPRGVVRYMDQATHRREAPAFRAAFARMELAAAEDDLRLACRAQLDALVEASARQPGGLRTRPFVEAWAMRAFARVMLGLPGGDRRIATLGQLVAAMPLRRTRPGWRRELQRCLDAFVALLRTVEDDRAAGRAGIEPGSALQRLLEQAPDALEQPSRVYNFALVFAMTHGDVSGLCNWLLAFLGDDSAACDAIRAAGRHAGPHDPDAPDPAACAVMETLRLEQSEYLYRKVTRAFEMEGRVIPAGWLLRMCINESHRDPAVFEQPDRFMPMRFAAGRFTRLQYSPFGDQRHGCMGSHFALLLGRILAEEASIGYDWTVVADGPPERGTRHRDHWTPSARRRVVVRALHAQPQAVAATA